MGRTTAGMRAGQRNQWVEVFRRPVSGRNAGGETQYGTPVSVCQFFASVHERVNAQYQDGIHVANETLITIRGPKVDMHGAEAGMMVRWDNKEATIDAPNDLTHDGNARELQCRKTSYPNGGNPLGGC